MSRGNLSNGLYSLLTGVVRYDWNERDERSAMNRPSRTESATIILPLVRLCSKPVENLHAIPNSCAHYKCNGAAILV